MPKDIGLRVRETAPLYEKLKRSEAWRNLRSQARSPFISEVFLAPEEAKAHPPILLDISDQGFIVYDKDDFLKAVLEDIRRKLRELGARKVKASKGYYWVLKPDAKADEVVEV
jgi:hypothetical protein